MYTLSVTLQYICAEDYKLVFWRERERERERKRNGEESDIVILEFLFLALMKEYFEFIGFQFYNTFEVKFVVQIIKFLDCQ